jgi:cell wall-associated NlpC family hydrolase
MLDVSQYIGMPFKPLGREPGGCDCWGLARMIYHDLFNIKVPSLTYAEEFDPVELFDLMDKESAKWVPVELGRERPGDVLLLKALNPHVGVVVSRGVMIHIQKSTSACIDKYTATRWNKRILGIYRHADLA